MVEERNWFGSLQVGEHCSQLAARVCRPEIYNKQYGCTKRNRQPLFGAKTKHLKQRFHNDLNLRFDLNAVFNRLLDNRRRVRETC